MLALVAISNSISAHTPKYQVKTRLVGFVQCVSGTRMNLQSASLPWPNTNITGTWRFTQQMETLSIPINSFFSFKNLIKSLQQSCGLLYDHFFQRGYYYRSRSGCHWNTREFKSFCSKKLWNILKTFSANVMLDLRLHGTPWLYLLYSKQPRKFCQDCSSWHHELQLLPAKSMNLANDLLRLSALQPCC